MVGLIVPGGWEEFFRFIGEPYDGPLWPLDDQRNVFEVLIPKLKAAAEQFDMIPLPQHKQFGPSPWKETENKLPGKLEPYFLKNATGPAYLAGGTVVRPLITTAESDGKFVIGSIEGCGDAPTLKALELAQPIPHPIATSDVSDAMFAEAGSQNGQMENTQASQVMILI